MYRERMMEKLQEAQQAVEKVRRHFPEKEDRFLHMGLEKDGIYKNIEFAIQSIIDICAILVKEHDLGVPAEEVEVFTKLRDHKILPLAVVRTIQEMRGFRNVLVHQYGAIDDHLAYKDIKSGLKDFTMIFNALEKAIENKR